MSFKNLKVNWILKIDFVIPGYRDFQIGKFLFSEMAEVFKKRSMR